MDYNQESCKTQIPLKKELLGKPKTTEGEKTKKQTSKRELRLLTLLPNANMKQSSAPNQI